MAKPDHFIEELPVESEPIQAKGFPGFQLPISKYVETTKYHPTVEESTNLKGKD